MSQALLAEAVRRLSAASVDSPRRDARILWNHAQGDRAAFEACVERRAAREPIAYIVGHKEFWSLEFAVGPGILVPRPETETLIEQVLKFHPDRAAPLRALDLGCGSGCLIVSFLKEFPNAHGMAIDRLDVACDFTRRNAERHGVLGRCEIRQGDWSGKTLPEADVILANPPYIRTDDLNRLEPEVAAYEPRGALDGGADGLQAYRMLAPAVAISVGRSGLGFVEVGIGQAEPVGALLAVYGLKIIGIAPDLAGTPRVLVIGASG
ncbi:MAG: peptide chain release factor N(5)-glutamine methyltransferase [Alphaproteobacteria bacterium]|nr:peptide chain release factor N(5)-glutamine methyltransferase [Alphaproteobacteria bacterium]